MADELQDALTSATPDPIEELKNEIGLKDEVKTEAAPKEKAEVKESESDDIEADEAVEPKKETTRNPLERKLSRQAAANRRQLETIESLKSELEQLKKAGQATPEVKGPAKPNMDDFDDVVEYDKAMSKYQDELVDFKAEQRFKQREQELEQRRQQERQAQEFQEQENAFTEREQRFKARHKNYDRNAQSLLETLEYLPEESMQGAQILRQYVGKSEFGPALVHHLGADPDLIEDISSNKDPIDVIKALYRIEMSLEKLPADTKKIPEPIDKLRPSNSGGKALTDMSWDEMKQKLNL